MEKSFHFEFFMMKEFLNKTKQLLHKGYSWFRNLPKNNQIIALVSSGLLIVVLFFSVFLAVLGSAVGDGEKEQQFEIEAGDGIIKVSRELAKSDLIQSPTYFQFLLYFHGESKKIKQGIYDLNDGMSAREIMDIIVSGKVATFSLTIPEGYHNRQIAELFVEKKIVDSKEEFFEIATSEKLLKKYKIPAKTTEGYLFPETYIFPLNYKPKKIIEAMIKRFFINLKTIPKAKDNTPEEIHKKVILASIIEREAKKDEDRPKMAGVFLKRLEYRMPLESCATVQYLFDKPKKRLFKRDLQIESPYNTYLHRGLPPGAISNPGLAALKAAYNPEKSDYLFFLVKPDGYHHFSKTLTEHINAKRKYIDRK